MKVITIKKEYILIGLYLIIIFIGIIKNYESRAVSTFSNNMSNKTVVIDIGHGGWDPGKVGSMEVLEKDINLQIGEKLKDFFAQSGIKVIMTRTEDIALGDTKNDDLKKRIEIINTNKADVLISIHQNSYTDESVKGAQAFYFGESEVSKELAEMVQMEIKTSADTSNTRKAKGGSDYYILKKTSAPAILVECGFLSSPEDSKNLTNDDYQSKIAWAIFKGTTSYLSK